MEEKHMADNRLGGDAGSAAASQPVPPATGEEEEEEERKGGEEERLDDELQQQSAHVFQKRSDLAPADANPGAQRRQRPQHPEPVWRTPPVPAPAAGAGPGVIELLSDSDEQEEIAAAGVAGLGSWACSLCTFIGNGGSRTTCEVCEASRTG